MTKKSVVARSAPPTPYHPSPLQDSKDAVLEAYCPDLRCTPQAGMGKIVAVARMGNLDIGSAHSRNPRRVVTRCGVARRAGEEERAWMSLLFSCKYMWGKNLPYKEVQLPLN